MAKKFIDLAQNTENSAVSEQDGSALTLTNQVRILYDNTVSPAELVAAIRRGADRVAELLG